jgi:hypothetical protein
MPDLPNLLLICRRRLRRVRNALGALTLVLAVDTAPAARSVPELILRGGTDLDGTGAMSGRADVPLADFSTA